MQMPWEITERKEKLTHLARSITGSKKAKALLFSFDGKCYYCENPIEALGPKHPRHPTRDHKIPKVRGGKNEPGNIVLACIACNVTKGDMDTEEYRHFIATGTLHPNYVEWLTLRLRRAAELRGIRTGGDSSSASETKK